MNKIVVRRTSIVINNYELGDSWQLEKKFSVYDQLTHQRYPKGIYYDTERNKAYIPRGMNIGMLEHIFETNAVFDESHDPFDTVDPILIRYLPRDEVQKEAIEFVLGQGKWVSNRYKSQLSVNLNTGKGKTYVAIVMMSTLRQRTIMITTNRDWITQWKKNILEYTNIKNDEIFILNGSRSIVQLSKGEVDLRKIKFIMSTHATIQSFAAKHGWDSIAALFASIRVGLKIYDEAHLNFDNMCMIDSFSNTYRTLYLTATPARSDYGENIVYQLTLKNVPKIDLFDEEKDPHTRYISMHFNSHPTPQQVSSCRTAYGFDRLRYVKYITNKPCFYQLLYILLDFCLQKEGKILIYIGLNDAIDKVYEWMKYNFPMLRGNIGKYNSTIPKEARREQLDKKVILSTLKSCGAAVDIKGLKITLLLADPTGSLVQARQALGRTRDRDTYFLDVVDDGFAALRRYYAKKRPMFNKYAESMHDINITDQDFIERVDKIKERISNQFTEQLTLWQDDNIGRLKKVVERV